MKRVSILAIIFVLLLASVGAASAAEKVQNGGFEQPGGITAHFQTLTSGLTDWSIDANSIDLIRDYWSPHSGSYSIDLAGNAPGTISQPLSTSNGDTCTLSFWMAGNQDNGGGTKTVRVYWGSGEVSGSPFTFTSTAPRTPMGWEQKSASGLTASGPTVLKFVEDPSDGAYGAALDDISVDCTGGTTPVPEFPTLALPLGLIIGVLGAVFYIRETRRQ
jgi:choice-of-anchor C domain-containing protein